MELNVLLGDTENQKCFHCEVEKIESVSINNAIYLCEDCALSHKKLGIFHSIIVPVDEKLWHHDFEVLLLGGNRQLKDFLGEFDFKRDNIRDTMTSKAADFYRRMIRATADNRNFDETKPTAREGVKVLKKPGKIGRFFKKSRSMTANSSRILSGRPSTWSNLSQTFVGDSEFGTQSVICDLSFSSTDSPSLRDTDRNSTDYRYQVVKTLAPSTPCEFEGYI